MDTPGAGGVNSRLRSASAAMKSRCTSRRHSQRREHRARRTPLHITQQGIALLEVLLVATLLGIALLGLASMQTSSLRFNHGAYLHTQAALLAQDILERMRANRAGVVAGYYDDINVMGTSLPSQPACPANQCTPEEMTVSDVRTWGISLDQILPNGEGAVRRLSDSDRFEVIVRWRENTGLSTDPACTAIPAQEVSCFTLSATL